MKHTFEDIQSILWYTIPGAIVCCSVALVFPHYLNLINNKIDLSVSALIFAAVGFTVHQVARFFSIHCFGVYHNSKYRPVLKDISDWLSIAHPQKKNLCVNEIKNTTNSLCLNNCIAEDLHSFAIWEIAFYSKKIPEHLTKQNKSDWIMIHSLYCCSLSIFFASVSCFWSQQSCCVHLLIAVALTVIFLILFLLAEKIRCFVNIREQYLFKCYRSKFDDLVVHMKPCSNCPI